MDRQRRDFLRQAVGFTALANGLGMASLIPVARAARRTIGYGWERLG